MIRSRRFHFHRRFWLERGQVEAEGLHFFLQDLPDTHRRKLAAVLRAVGLIAGPAAGWTPAGVCGAGPVRGGSTFLGLGFDYENGWAGDGGLFQVRAVGLKGGYVARWRQGAVGQLVPRGWRRFFARFFARGSPGMSAEGGRRASGGVDSFRGVFGAVFLGRLGLGLRMRWLCGVGKQGVDLQVL